MIVAGVNGNAMGLGVTMLPLFDVVYATDKAEFFLPYTKLGQVPEGGATYTFPNYYGKLQSNKLFLGQKITASQAEKIGLVTEAFWPATFQESLLPKVASLATQSPISMEGTKALVNHHILTKLELSVESECRILLQQWTSPNFSNMCKRFLDSTEVQLQKPVNLPL
ncbi:Chromodomain Y-like protein [Armadillidium nasatum]|uniref:Chromodomain Y-like protein n=1 Tax=Armadillidium nasatum TaxID=96803 RepID=A0A5N5T0B7_9CRUS|nr:Chromodomain Y-like protein [Armadillidium nasatum]